MPDIQTTNELTYHQRVAKTLEPLEERWGYIQDVLLWKKPKHSLCYVIAMNAFFSWISTGWCRIFLVCSIVVASSLLVEEVRVPIWHFLERGGISHGNESSDSALSFSGVCEKVASVWQFAANGYTKIHNMKTRSKKKFCAIVFCAILVLVYAYQYLPIIQIIYIIICALFFQPAVKYYGVGKVVQKGLGPFYRPFVIQWQNSRTKRERRKVLKEVNANDDSDEEFTSEFNPAENTAQPHLFTDEESDKEFGKELEDHPDEPIPIISLPSDSTSQASEFTPEDPDTTSSVDTQSLGDEIAGSASLENSAAFIEGLDRIPSVRSYSLEDNDFMEGLKFPDIGGEPYHSSTESLDQTDGKRSSSAPLTGTAVQRQPAHLATSSQQSSLDVSDFEVLDKSEAEGMAARNEAGGHSPGNVNAISSYIGKWLGY